MALKYLEEEKNPLASERIFLQLPRVGQVDEAILFSHDVELLPPLMQTVLNNIVTKKETGGFFERLAAKEDLDGFLELSREMLRLFRDVNNMPDVIENLSMRFAKLIDKQPEDQHTKRRDIAEKWLGELEKGVKASQLVFVVRNLLAKWGNGATVTDEYMSLLAKWSYEVQGGKYKYKDDKEAKGYVDFTAEFSEMIDKISGNKDLGDQIVDQLDPTVAPWLYLLLGHDERPMMARMYKEAAPRLKNQVSLVVGVSAFDWELNSEGKMRERKPSIKELFADTLWPDGNYPDFLKGIVEPYEQRGIAIGAGQDIAINFKEDSSTMRKFIDKHLDYIAKTFRQDGREMHEKLGYEVPAVWLSLPMDLINDVMGSDSTWSAYLAEVSHINKQEVNLNVPVAVSEARDLLDWQLPSNIDKNSIMVRALVYAHIFRRFGLHENHGFGGLNDLYNTPFWATLAYNLSLPEDSGYGHQISLDKLNDISARYNSEDDLALMLGQLLSQRTTNLALTVMGGNDSALNERARSMQSGSYAVLESARLFGLYEQYREDQLTTGIGHSMGAQIIRRMRLLLPASVRKNVDLISLTGVTTNDPREMTFVNSGLNRLMPILIKLRTHANKGMRQFGNALSFAGEIIPIKKMLLKRFTHPNAKYELDYLHGGTLAAIHRKTLENTPRYLLEQNESLYNLGDTHTIEELTEAIAVIGGADVLNTLGINDPVLAAQIALNKYRQLGTKKHKEIDFTQMELEQIVAWAKGADKEDGPGRPSETIVGEFDHYMESTRQGRWVLRMMLMRTLGVKQYGSKTPIIG